MSHAPSLWLRTRYMLLLVPLLWASAASAQLLPSFQIHWEPLPATATAGESAQFTVVALGILGEVNTSYGGTVTFASTDPNADLPPNTTFTSTDRGRKTFAITYKKAGVGQGVSVWEVDNRLIIGRRDDITVEPGPPYSFALGPLPTIARAGQSVTLPLIARDAYGNLSRYEGTPVLTSSDPRATLSSDTTGPRVTFRTVGTHSFTLVDSANPSLRVESAGILVAPGEFHHYTLETPRPRASTCETMEIAIKPVDEFGNLPTFFPRRFILCATSSHSATIASTSNLTANMDGQCIHGELTSADGAGTLSLSNRVDETVTFETEGTLLSTRVTLDWDAGVISSTQSTFFWSDGSDDVRDVKVPSAAQGLRLQLRNACGTLLDPPPDRPLDFAVEAPLILEDLRRVDDGDYTVSVKLTECPPPEIEHLAVWPTLGREPLPRPGTPPRLQRQVRPECLQPVVEISVRPEKEGEVAAPGDLVEFLVEIENKGELAVRNGVIHIAVNGMTVLEAKLDGVALTRNGEGFVLPKLELREKLTVKVKAQVTAKLDQPATATVWYTSSGGTPLTPEQVVSFDMDGLGVDVGCGCHAGDLPSQFLPLLALLLVGSRPRARLRRLARGERTDR